MKIQMNAGLISGFKSPSQMARALTESWAGENMFCPRCGRRNLERFPNCRPVADFFCPCCGGEFELKAKRGKFGKKINDGAYDRFIERICSNNNPDFLILSYDFTNFCVNDLWIIPKHFFTPALVEKRNPLPPHARRAGWVGCNILFEQIPAQGKIDVVRNRIVIDKEIVMQQMQRASLLSTDDIDTRGWLLDVLACVNKMPQRFSLREMYACEPELQMKHPQNNNIKAKIRQQLQLLRDRQVIEFIGRGLYQKIQLK